MVKFIKSGIIFISLFVNSNSKIHTIKLERTQRDKEFTVPRVFATSGLNAYDLTSIQDLYYNGPVIIANQTFNILFDTGSAMLWVPQINCSECSIAHNMFVVSDTTTDLNSNFNITYGSGPVAGYFVKDDVNIGGLVIPNQKFGVATQIIFQYYSEMSFDGILGIAWPQLTGSYEVPAVIPAMKAAGLIDSAVFGLYVANGEGEVTIGGVDETRYTGNITWIPLTRQLWWTVNSTGLLVGASAVPAVALEAILDSGTSLITGPKSAVTEIVAQMRLQSGVSITMRSGLPVVKCSDAVKLPSLSFILQGGDGIEHTMTVPGAALIVGIYTGNTCYMGLNGVADMDQWIIGDPFLRVFYSIHDYENSRVGLALSTGPSTVYYGSEVTSGAASKSLGAAVTLAVLLLSLWANL